MNKNLKKFFIVITYMVVVIIFVGFVLIFVNNYSIAKKSDLRRTSLGNEKVESSENAITELKIINEDSDVYLQRQMRAEYNEDASSSGY